MVDEIVETHNQKFKMINMKIKVNKWIGMITATFLLLATLNSCVKDRNPSATDFSGLKDHVTLVGGGITNFSSNNIRFSGDTASYKIIADLASVNLPTSPVNVTLAVDSSLVTAYNIANGTNFLPLPSNAYKIASTSLAIPAGQQYATTTVEIYKDKVDPVKSYLLTVSIKDASGKLLTSNLNTIYFNIIGNIIAGDYKWDFTRWGQPSNTGSPDITFTGHTATFVADNGNQVEVPSGYYIGPRYVISFTNNAGVLSDFSVKMNADDVATMSAGGVSITDGPNIIKVDPIAGEYIFQYKTKTRYVIDRYYK
jgi:hypothetical protein